MDAYKARCGAEYTADVTYSDGAVGRVRLSAAREGNTLVVTLPKEALEKPAEYVDFMPMFAPAREGERGYILINNYLIRFDGHTGARADAGGNTYGDPEAPDARYDAGHGLMRFFGVLTPRECFACVVTGLASQHSLIAERANGVYTAHARFILDGLPAREDMALRYIFLSGGDADYSGMARAYREYQLEHTSIKRISERMNDALEYMLNAPEVRVRLAWKPVPTPVEEQTIETEPELRVAVSFERVGDIMDALKACGVDKAEICLVGWNVRGHDGRWPDAFPVEQALGGEAKLRALIDKARRMGYRIVCHTNATDSYSISSRWSESLPMRARDGAARKNAQWGGGRMYDMCPVSGGEKYSLETIDRVAELGFRGLHYVDVISIVPPRRCFASAHPCTQAEYERAMRNVARRAAERMGGFQSEGGYDYMAGELDMSLYVDFHMTRAPHPLVSENVPAWQIVYHDIILSNPGPETVNYTVKGWREKLKFIEYGGHPAAYIHSKFTCDNHWMGESDLTCEDAPALKTAARAIADMMSDYKAVNALASVPMISHERRGDAAIVTYANGARIVCNYADAPVIVSGVSVPARDWRVIAK